MTMHTSVSKKEKNLTERILVRHGQSSFWEKNADGVIKDVEAAKKYSLGEGDLSEKGALQAKELVPFLTHKATENSGNTVFLLSPFPRLIQTFAPTIQSLYGIDLISSPVVQEAYSAYRQIFINGDIANLSSYKTTYEVCPQVFVDIRLADKCEDGPAELTWSEDKVGKGESTLAAWRRVSCFVAEVNEKYRGKTIIVGSHATALLLLQKTHTDFVWPIDQQPLWQAGGTARTLFFDGQTPVK